MLDYTVFVQQCNNNKVSITHSKFLIKHKTLKKLYNSGSQQYGSFKIHIFHNYHVK